MHATSMPQHDMTWRDSHDRYLYRDVCSYSRPI